MIKKNRWAYMYTLYKNYWERNRGEFSAGGHIRLVWEKDIVENFRVGGHIRMTFSKIGRTLKDGLT
jgi:hypothetical protein